MKNQKRNVIATVVILAAVSLVPMALAQSEALRATIPFDFYVSGTLLPAGTYTIATQPNGHSIQFRGGGGNSAYVMTTAPAANSRINESRIVFHRYGNAHFLSNIYWAGSKVGKEVASSKIEQLAKNGVTPTPVAVVAK